MTETRQLKELRSGREGGRILSGFVGLSLWNVTEATGEAKTLTGHPGWCVKSRPQGPKAEVGRPVKRLVIS